MKSLAINFVRENKTARILLTYFGLIVLAALVGKVFPTFAGVILCLLLLGGYYGVLIRCLKFCDVNFLDEFINDLPRIFLASTLGTIFIICVVNSQQTIYFWDSLETWEPTVECSEITFADPHQALKDLRGSINHSDYNKFLPMLMALPMYIFGKSFLCYALYVWLMFGLPGIFIAATTFKAVLNKAGGKTFPPSAIMAIIMLLPALEIPIFVGYANISILLPAATLLALLLSLDTANLQRERLIFIAALCVFAVFQARTAAYMILGIFFGYTLYIIISSAQKNTLQRDFALLCKKFLYIGAFGLIITLPLFFTFVKHALTYDIGTAYSAYQLGMDFSARFFQHVSYLGVAIYALFIIGAIICFANKKLLPYAAFFAAWFFTVEILICRVQLIDRQHNYAMILPFAFMILALAAFVRTKRKEICAVLLLILTFNFCQAYSTALNVPKIFNTAYIIPVRHDIKALKTFVSELNNLTAGKKQIYFLSSSALYNPAILKYISFPETNDALPNLMVGGDIDLRDGFPTKIFDADYIIVPEPIQIHMRAQDQSVVVSFAEGIKDAPQLSRHFKQIDEYKFSADGNSVVKLILYEKISPYEKADIDFVEKYYDELYPNQPDLFKNRFEKYKRENFKE